jgi:hypothetical protein
LSELRIGPGSRCCGHHRHTTGSTFGSQAVRLSSARSHPATLFLFKLHGPDNNIVGGGIFSHASIAPLSIAWEAFRPKNGVASADEMRKRVAYYRREPSIIELRQDFR